MNSENLYNSPFVANRIKNYAKSKRTPLKTILEDCNLGSNTFSHMLHGRMIAADSLARIADYLDCTVDYLLGRTDCPDIVRSSKAIQFPQEESFLIAAEDGSNIVKKADKKPIILP